MAEVEILGMGRSCSRLGGMPRSPPRPRWACDDLETRWGILILPGTVLVVVPALILWLAHGTALEARPAGIEDPRSWIGVLLFCVGLVFAIGRVAKVGGKLARHGSRWSWLVGSGSEVKLGGRGLGEALPAVDLAQGDLA